MTDLKFVYLDLGYTLCDETPSWEARFAEQCATVEAQKAHITPKIILDTMKITSAKRASSPYCEAIKLLGLKQPVPYRPEFEVVYPCAAKVLSQLAKRFRLGILANQVDGMCERLERFGILQYFDVTISSFDLKLSKPDLQLFCFAAEKTSCKPSQIAMIGDRLDNDIAPAKALGWHTIWLKQGFGAYQSPTDEHDTPDFALDLLEQVPSVI